MAKEEKPDEPKIALQKLLKLKEYTGEQEVSISRMVWDIVIPEGGPERADAVLASNLFGTEEEVRKFAEEAFGSTRWHNWALKPSRVKMIVIHVSTILKEVGIPLK